jgi:membrane-associated two-gene conflict system component 1 (EACC1)
VADHAQYQIKFVGMTPAEADTAAADLADFLKNEVTDRQQLQVDRQRTKAGSQDFGATLVLILGTAAATAVAKGIRAWLTAHTGTTIEITDPTGAIVARNIDAKNAAEIAKAWSAKH